MKVYSKKNFIVLCVIVAFLFCSLHLFIFADEVNDSNSNMGITIIKDSIEDNETETETDNDNDEENNIIDSLSFKYYFEVGDSLYYSIFSRDSISINYDVPLLRLREEKILITCDSINKQGNFCLTHRLIDADAVESYKDEKNIKREKSMWVNMPVYIELDSLGRRIKVFNKDTNKAVSAPGGVFQPILFITLSKNGENRKGINESWLNSSTDELVENGFPLPIFKSTTLVRLKGITDTMGYDMMQFTFVRSGQASYELLTEEYSIKTAGIINSGGEIYIDTTFWVPIVLIHTLEQKLTFYYPDDREQPGRHFIYATFICNKIVRNNKVYYPASNLKNIK